MVYSQKRRTVMGFEVREEGTNHVDAGVVKVNAIDNGGIRSRTRDGEVDDFIALFEVKKRLHIVGGDAYVSDEDLAQMAYEAIVAHKHRDKDKNSVVIIHAA